MTLDDLAGKLSTGVRSIMDTSQEGVVLVDAQGTIYYANVPFYTMTHPFHQGAALGKNIFRDYPFEAPEHKSRLLTDVIRTGGIKGSSRVKYDDGGQDGKYFNIQISPLEDGEGAKVGLVNVTREVLQASRDVLTDAYSQSHFLRELFPNEKRKAEREKSYLGIIIADFERFKAINDTYGHSVGDDVLIRTTRVLKSAVREGEDYVVRYGGDEWYILLPRTSEDRIKDIIKRIEGKINLNNAGTTDEGLKIRLNLGCVCDNKNYDDLISRADQLMYEHKNRRRELEPIPPNPSG